MRKKAFVVTLVAAIVGGVGYVVCHFIDINSNEARAYAEEAVCETTYYWQPKTLFDRTTDMYKQYHDYTSTLIYCMSSRGRFGCIRGFEHPYGSLGLDYRPGAGIVLTGDYVVVGDFAGNKGTITIAIAKIKGEWKIDNFQIQSGVLPDYEDHATERALAPKMKEDVPPANSVASR